MSKPRKLADIFDTAQPKALPNENEYLAWTQFLRKNGITRKRFGLQWKLEQRD